MSMRDRRAVAPWALSLSRARGLALVVALALTTGSALLALRLELNFSPENLFVSGDPALAFYLDRQVPAFGAGDTVCAVAVHARSGRDLTDAGVQDAIVTLHRRLKDVPGVLGVTSPLDARLPMTGALGFDPLFSADGRASPEALARAATDPLLGGLLLSRDLRAAAVSARLDPSWGNEATRREVVAAVQRIVDEVERAHPEVELLLAGVPVSQVTIVDTLQRDQLRFVPLVVLIMGALLWLSFRDLRGVVLPFLATGAATVWTLGYLVLVGHAINVVNNAIVVLLLVIGVADAVHLVARFKDELERARSEAAGGAVDKDLVIARTLEAMTLPCFLTTTTTAIGFASALVADVALIREFGVDAAVGVLLAFVATLLIVPALLGVLPLPAPRARHPLVTTGWLHGALEGLTRAVIARRLEVLLVFAGLLVVAARLAVDVSANQRVISELPDTDPSLEATRFFEEHLAGILAVDVVFVAERPGRLQDPDVVRAMDRIARFAQAQPLSPRTLSYADVLRGLERALSGSDAAEPVSSWSDEKIRQLQLLFELATEEDRKKATDGLVSDDGTLSRVRGLAKDAGTDAVTPFVAALSREVEGLALEGVEVRISGGLVIASKALANIVRDMASSLGVALVAILVFMTVLFRSLRVSLVALLPNAVPIVAALAVQTLLGIELRVATALIFSMALGVAVDACVHLLARLREEQQAAADDDDPLREALVRTMRGAGRPVVYATGLLLIGFLVMAFSEFNALRHFAVLGGATLAAALVVDLVLLPALVYVASPRR